MSDQSALTVDDLYRVIRERILHCELEPGATISQVQLAEALRVNRTPLREALRMLQRDRLIEGEYNRRVRIAPLSSEDLEQIYAQRITEEALAIRLSVPRMTPVDLDELEEVLARIQEHFNDEDPAIREAHHREFHRRLVVHAGDRIAATCGELADYGERYRRALIAHRPISTFELAAKEHAAILEACRAGDPQAGAELLARHLARAALSLSSISDPAHDPIAVREALRTVTSAPIPVA
jgi:DNA-binding GntR family transcriptional regulator